MAALCVRGPSDEAVAELKKRAARNGQSTEAYVRTVLEQEAAVPSLDEQEAATPSLDEVVARIRSGVTERLSGT